MADAGVRVALLARAGKARDQLHRALSEVGARIVVEGDPAELDPEQVAGQEPTVFLVSLEPAIEAALDRFDELLAAPGIEVMFDDAEVTAKLDGWDLNRWARHLANKLLGSEGLPPVPEGSPAWPEELTIRPGAPPTPAELMDHARLEDYTNDTSELADSVPVSPSLLAEDESLELDFDLGLSADDFAQLRTDVPEESAEAHDEALARSYGELEMGGPVSFSSFSEADPEMGDLDADVAELAAQLEAFEKTDQRVAPSEPEFTSARSKPLDVETIEAIEALEVAEVVAIEAVAAAPAPRAAASFDFSNLALAPIEGEPEPVVAPAKSVPEFVAKPSALELADAVEPARTASHEGLGAVLIFAGLGGPDAVRQLLSSLPEGLPVPVLLYQHLEVGKHERLVEQLAKISRLPVLLAREGAALEAGKVNLLPAGLTATASGNSLSFCQGALSQLIVAVSAQESAIVVLSGADEQLVPMIVSVRDAGGLVLAQDPQLCFDAAASEAMQRQGAAVYPALGLARQIAARWSL